MYEYVLHYYILVGIRFRIATRGIVGYESPVRRSSRRVAFFYHFHARGELIRYIIFLF